MVKHTQTIRRQFACVCLSVLDYFVGLALKRLSCLRVIEHNQRNIFLQKSCREWSREASSRPLFVFLKSCREWSTEASSRPQFYMRYISITRNLAYDKKKVYKTIDPEIAQFWFLRKTSRNIDCLYFLKYWAIGVLHLFVSQVVTS